MTDSIKIAIATIALQLIIAAALFSFVLDLSLLEGVLLASAIRFAAR